MCKRLESLSYLPPPQSDLPEFIAKGIRAFESSVFDHCGQVYTKMYSKSKHLTKNYVSITTCATSTMIH